MLHHDSSIFLAQLRDVCQARRATAAWIIVPSHAVGLTLGDRLAREGTSWMHLHFVTPTDLAVRMAGPFLVDAGVDPNDDTLGPAVMLRVLGDVRADTGFYRDVDHHPSMAEAWWRTLQELRMAGLGADDLRADAFTSPDKHAAVVAVVRRYDALLRDERRADLPTVFAVAIRHATYCPVRPGDVRIEYPHAPWPVLVRRFLDALPGAAMAARALEVPGARPSERTRRLCAPVEPVAPDPARARGAARLCWIRALDRLPAPQASDPDASLRLFKAGGQLAEVDAVVRRIVQSRQPFDAIEIACAHEEQAQMVWERALRHGWPVTLGTGVSAALTQPGRALVAYCRWLEDDLSARVVIGALHDGAWRPAGLAAPVDVEGTPVSVSAAHAARILTRSKATWGRATFARSLSRLEAQYTTRANDPDEEDAARDQARLQALRTRRVREWMAALVDAAPVAVAGDVAIADVVGAARRLVAGVSSRVNALDRLAAAALDAALGELRGLGDRRATLSTAVRFVEEQVAGVRVGRDRPRPGHLHIDLLRDAGRDGRPLTFVMGLEEGQLLPVVVEDPILLDDERATISEWLATSRSRLDDAVWTVTRRLAEIGYAAGAVPPGAPGASTAVHLSYSCRDVRQFRDTYPSSFLLQAFRAHRGESGLSLRDLEQALDPPETPVPAVRGEAGSDAEWWMHDGVTKAGEGLGDVETAFPWTRRGRGVSERRHDTRVGAADGVVPVAGPLLDPSVAGMVVSSSTLERAAECPFRYFLQYGLDIKAPDEHEREVSLWLDPLTRGSALHELFATLMREVRDEHGGVFSIEVQRPRLRTLGNEMLARLRDELPPPSETVFDRERQDFLYDLDLFVDQQAERTSEGIGFEVAFGMARDAGRDRELGSDDPIDVELPAGRRLRLRGSIDRIDRIGDGLFEVIDYKTGSFYEPRFRGTFGGAMRLQHAIYAVAAEAVLAGRFPGARVTQSTYWFPSATGRQQQKIVTDNTLARTATVLGDVCDTIAAGVFVQAEAEGACRFCDYARVCGDKPWKVIDRKFNDPGNRELDVVKRMRRHE